MATIGLGHMRVVGTTLGVSTPTMHGYEAASQTFKRFEVLKIKSNGYLEVATDDDPPVHSNTGVVGLATADASGTTAADLMFEPFIPGITLIEANLCADSAAAAHVSLLANFWTVAYGLSVDSNKWFLAVDNTADATIFALPIRVAAGSTLGDTNARVIAVVVSSAFVRWGADV